MTNKEAIMLLNPSTTASALAEIEYYHGFRGQEACIKAIEDACILAVEAFEKADKYRWHDLRKNPDDLPEADEYGCSEYVLVMIGTLEWDNHEWAYYNHNTRMWSTPFYEQNVFAWRYIEPFKEEE